MLHIESPEIRKCLLQGKFGLEKEGLRVYEDASMAQTPHPFPDDSHITRDFSENQTEINTSAEPSAEGAVLALEAYARRIRNTISSFPRPEYIWPFSNPPFLAGEEDIPIAQFAGELASKTAYREYLSGRYGRYKMTFSGIHVNYSFSDELLKKEFSLRGEGRSRSFRDSFYLELAEKAAAYGWLLVILTAASPVLDASYFERESISSEGRRSSAAGDRADEKMSGRSLKGRDVFTGMASVRCSELGYWNDFVPVFDYTNIQRYADGIRRYVDAGLLYSVSELYFPVRLKSKGENSLDALKETGVDHIELRMFDLNPLASGGLDVRDVQFTQLFLIWLASLPRRNMSLADQVQSVQNFKNAARYDLRTVHIVMPEFRESPVENALEAALHTMERIRAFYRPLLPELPDWVEPVLRFENEKLKNPQKRYAEVVRERFSGTFLEKGMEYAMQETLKR
jgi:glutamate--cysteine ligase